MAGVLLREILHGSSRRLDSLSTSSAVLRRLLVPGAVDPLVRSPATSVQVNRVPATSALVRSVHLDTSRCAGHNKWSKVRHIKGPKDAERSRLFAKFGKMIKIAVKDGGPNPNFNASLANILEQCRSYNMPKSTVDSAIKTAEKAKGGTQHVYEARGPGGCVMLIEVLTQNNTHTHHTIKHLLSKNGGVLKDGAHHIFDRKGVVVAEARGLSTENALDLAIEAGAEDVQEVEEEEERPQLKFICSLAELSVVRTALETRGIQVVSSGLEFVSHTPSLLDPSQLELASVLLDALNDCSDVMRVWDNIQAEP